MNRNLVPSKRMLIGLAVLAVLLLGGVALLVLPERPAAQAAEAPAESLPGVVVATVEEQGVEDVTEAVGTTLAFESVELMPSVTETVERFHFEEGQLVERGQVLATLVRAEETAQAAAARATVAEEAREVGRLEELVAEGAAAQALLDERRTRLERARQELEVARARLDDRVIRAPFAGVVGTRRVSPGALATPGTVLTTLDDLQTIKLDFTVPETVLGTLERGQAVEATSPALPGRSFSGVVTHIDPRVDPVSRSVVVRAELPNPDFVLRPGMLLQVRLITGARQGLVVPERALVPLQNRTFVFALEEQRADSNASPRAVRTEIQTGRRAEGFVEVTRGLTAGQRVVTQGLQALQDGDAVTVAGTFDEPAPAFRVTGGR